MDIDRDSNINYKEFCGFSEEKRRNIDPFDSADTQQRLAKHMGLNNESLAALSQSPYNNLKPGQINFSELYAKS